MNASHRTHYEALLLQEQIRIRNLLNRIASAGYKTVNPLGMAPGEEVEAGAVGVGAYDDDALATRETVALTEVENALHQIHTAPDSYGVCTKCGQRIAEPRLEIVPATRYCQKHAA